MSYENKVVIIHNLKDFDAGRTARHGTYNLQEKLDELDEVYRKAEAFDEMRETVSVVLDDIYEREITHADLGYQAIGRELTVIMDNLEKED